MAIQNFCGFETGNANNATNGGGEHAGSSGTFEIQTGVVKTGVYALRIYPTTTAVGHMYFRKQDSGGEDATMALATTYLSVDVRVATRPGSADEPILACHNGSAYKFELRLDSSGYLKTYDSTPTLIATSTSALSLDTWYRLDVKVGTGTTTGVVEVRIDGSVDSALSTSSANLTASNTQRVYLGKIADRNGQGLDVYYDNLTIDSAAYANTAAVVEVMIPNEAGTYSDFSGLYSEVDEIPTTSTTDYWVSTLSAGQANTVGLESAASAGISGTIVAVKPYMTTRRVATSTSTKLRTRTNSTNYDLAAANNGTSQTIAYCTIYENNPQTATTWTTDELDALEIGCVENSATYVARVHAVNAHVLFVPAVGQPRAARGLRQVYGVPASGSRGKWF